MATNLDDLQRRIAALPPEKRAIFEQQLKQRNLQMQASAISRRLNPADCPLSLSQQHLWFLHQLDPDSPAYNIAMLWRFTGNLDLNCFKQSLEAIAQRHETLRTAFVSINHQPIQFIQPNFQLHLPIIDLSVAPNEAQNQQIIKQIAQQIAQQPFDLAIAPLWRVVLIQTSTESIAVVTLHHSIADGWSRGILLQEFATVYKSIQDQQPIYLPELPIQYTDFAVWQQSQQSQLDPQLNYWREQLADLSPLTLNLVDRTMAIDVEQNQQGLRSETRSLSLSLDLLESLKKLSRQFGVTLFTTLLTAFNVLLYRYTEQTDIAIGIPTANRRQETESLIGFFVNTLVLRTDLSGNPNFNQLLKSVHQTATDAYKHQEIPFAKLVEALQPDRQLDQNPFFQIMFQVQNETYQLQNALKPDLNIANLTLEQEWIDIGFTKFDLTCHMVERANELLAVVEYRRDRFSATTIERMLGHFQMLLMAIVKAPHQTIGKLPLLTQPEHQALQAWRTTTTQRQLSDPLNLFHHQFEAQVKQFPDRIAVVFEDQQLTYQQLNEKANQLAHCLHSTGIRPNQIVGICMERSPDLMIALLGVLKSGSAYLPIDPQLPSDRIAFMLSDASVQQLLTDRLFADRALDCSTPILNLTDWQEHDQFPNTNPDPLILSENLAYIIYTSGSTGQPKGTLLTHGNLSHYLDWAVQNYVMPTAIGVPVQSSISFDATITSLYTPLMVGQAVILLPDAIESLAHLLTSGQQYSFIKLTPAHLRLLEQWLVLNHITSLVPQTFILGGEALTEADLTFWRNHSPDSQFINEYGPTEATVGCCVYRVPATTQTSQSTSQSTVQYSIPIGYPIFNTQLYILDAQLQPVPVGIEGELYIGGAGLSQGYLNQPVLTTEKFIDLNSERLYKTGDRACYLSDGRIEYLGRRDQQVKIRGYRIELEEIAARLQQHPDIGEAIVTTVTDHHQNTRLVAYITTNNPKENLNTVTLKQFLKTKLPDYMLPSLFIPIDSIPLTTNGKVDRQQLPPPNWTNQPAPELAAQTLIESNLCQIWSDLLGVPVGIHDNFFDLGGDSILSLQIIARANQIGLRFSPRQLFQHQTIAELALVVETSAPANQNIITGNVPLTPIQKWFFAQELTNPHHFNQALILKVETGLNPDQLASSLQILWKHHDALRLRFECLNGDTSQWRQFHADVDSNHAIALKTVDLTHLSVSDQTKAIAAIGEQLQASLDLSSQLWRSVLFRLGNQQTDRLLLISHHLVIDGFSWQTLLADLCQVYNQIQQQQQPQLPLKTTAFQDWANYLISNVNPDPSNQSELDYWTKQTGVPIPSLDEPASNTVESSQEVHIKLEAETTQALLKTLDRSRPHHLTAILLHSIFTACQQWTTHETLAIALESYGRDVPFRDVNLSRTIGWFTHIFPVCLQATSTAPYPERIQQIEAQLQAVPENGLNYGILRYLRTEPLLKDQVQPEIKFNYLGSIDRLKQSFILGLATESIGKTTSPQNQRTYAIEINSWLSQNQLHLSWIYSQNLHQRSTVEHLAQMGLQTLIQTATLSSQKEPIAANFPAARLNQKQLDQFMNQIQKTGRK